MSLLRNERTIKGARALRRLLYFWPAVGVVVTLAGAFAVSATNKTQIGGLLAPLREGFFDHLLRFMEHAVEMGFIGPELVGTIAVSDDPRDLLDALAASTAR